MIADNNVEQFTFSFTDYHNIESHVTRFSEDGFRWPDVIQDVVRILEKQYGYDIAPDIKIKGVSLDILRDDPLAYINPLQRLREIDEELDLFPETSAGLTD